MPRRKAEPLSSVSSGVAHFAYEGTEDEEGMFGLAGAHSQPAPAAGTPVAAVVSKVSP